MDYSRDLAQDQIAKIAESPRQQAKNQAVLGTPVAKIWKLNRYSPISVIRVDQW
jgi:hypothetical protein